MPETTEATESWRGYQEKPGGLFKPGNKGRPKGSKNSLVDDFLGDLKQAWKQQGKAAIRRMADESPSQFCQMVAKMVPQQVIVAAFGTENPDEFKQVLVELVGNQDAPEPAGELIEATPEPLPAPEPLAAPEPAQEPEPTPEPRGYRRRA